MCDPECRERFEGMERNLLVISTDIVWIKRICSVCAIGVCAAFGIDVSGVV